MKIDPHHHKEKYLKWKERVAEGIPNISKDNSDLIMQYINDMERGINVSAKSVKGCRSFIRLNTLRDKLVFFAKRFKEIYNLEKITDIKEEQLISFFSDLRNGVIKRVDGNTYISINTQGNVFKTFWHWHQRTSRKRGIEIPDITLDIDMRQDKPDWVYLTEEEVKKLCDNAKYDYRVLIMFLFDTGIRSPTELVNIKVSDLFNNFKELNIREEISKTFGRRIKLMLCSELIKEYVKNKDLQAEDYLFKISPPVVNRYLRRLALNLFGDKVSQAGAKYSALTMYDFRHNACCYWLPRYKSESALKYRFGWKKSDKIHYYSELLGMSDTINEDDMLGDLTKTEIEKKLVKTENENSVLEERVAMLERQMKVIAELIKQGRVIVTQET